MEILVLFLIMLFIVVLQALIFKKLSFTKLHYHCGFSTDEAFEGDTIELVETIYNRKWLTLPWFKSELTTSKWLDFAGSESSVTYDTRFVPSFFLVKGHKKVVRRWKVNCTKRGVYGIRTVMLVSTDLLGRQTVSKPVEVDSNVMVLPRTFDLSQAFLRARYLEGDFVVRSQILPDPFMVAGVREYLPSDPMKNIHWSATARMNRIMIRNQEYTTRQSLLLLLNMQSREFEKGRAIDADALEDCIRTAASLLEGTLQGSIPVSFAVNTAPEEYGEECVFVPSNFGSEHVLQLFRLLACLPAGSHMDFVEYINRLEIPYDTTDVLLVTSYVNERVFAFCRAKEREGIHVKVLLLRLDTTRLPDDCDIYYMKQEVQANGEVKPQ